MFYDHVYLNSVHQMVSGELAGEGLQTGFSRHGLSPQRAPLDTVYPFREHLNSVQRMVSGGYCEGSFPDTVCWTRLRNTWYNAFHDKSCHMSNPDLPFLASLEKARKTTRKNKDFFTMPNP